MVSNNAQSYLSKLENPEETPIVNVSREVLS